MKNLLTFIWGPILWRILEVIAWNSDNGSKSDAEEVTNAFVNIGSILPCQACKACYKDNLDLSITHMNKGLFDIVSNSQLLELVYTLHSFVNEKLQVVKFEKLKKIMTDRLSKQGIKFNAQAEKLIQESYLKTEKESFSLDNFKKKTNFLTNSHDKDITNTILLVFLKLAAKEEDREIVYSLAKLMKHEIHEKNVDKEISKLSCAVCSPTSCSL